MVIISRWYKIEFYFYNEQLSNPMIIQYNGRESEPANVLVLVYSFILF